jgi:hypothetical protein
VLRTLPSKEGASVRARLNAPRLSARQKLDAQRGMCARVF